MNSANRSRMEQACDPDHGHRWRPRRVALSVWGWECLKCGDVLEPEPETEAFLYECEEAA